MKRNYQNFCHNCDKEFPALRPKDRFCGLVCKDQWRYTFSEKRITWRKEYQKRWGQTNWQHKRDYMIMYTYGITSEQYQELLKKQNYSCAVCGKHETEFTRKLAIDHDHKTKEIFGLLCNVCNRVLIGKIREPELFLKAAAYLRKGTGWLVPDKKRKKRRCRRKKK